MEPQVQPMSDKPDLMKGVILPGIINFLIGVLVLGGMVLLLAGTIKFWQGWVFAVVFMAMTTAEGIYLSIKNPELLARRKEVGNAGQSRGQRILITVALSSMAAMVMFSALDHRFGWSQMPPFVSLIGDGLIVISFVVYYFVYRVNSYAASSIRVFEGQTVSSTGIYALVRHPKYAGDMFMLVGIPLALGSWWGLAFMAIVIPGMVWRILDEEKLLKKDLPGYVEYTQKVRYRLVPYLW